jgi:hypothetical protein
MAITKVFRETLQVNETSDVNDGKHFLVEVAIEVRSTKWTIEVSVDDELTESRSGEMLTSLAAAALSWPNAPKRKIVELDYRYFRVEVELCLTAVTCAIRRTGYSTLPSKSACGSARRTRRNGAS